MIDHYYETWRADETCAICGQCFSKHYKHYVDGHMNQISLDETEATIDADETCAICGQPLGDDYAYDYHPPDRCIRTETNHGCFCGELVHPGCHPSEGHKHTDSRVFWDGCTWGWECHVCVDAVGGFHYAEEAVANLKLHEGDPVEV